MASIIADDRACDGVIPAPVWTGFDPGGERGRIAAHTGISR